MWPSLSLPLISFSTATDYLLIISREQTMTCVAPSIEKTSWLPFLISTLGSNHNVGIIKNHLWSHFIIQITDSGTHVFTLNLRLLHILSLANPGLKALQQKHWWWHWFTDTRHRRYSRCSLINSQRSQNMTAANCQAIKKKMTSSWRPAPEHRLHPPAIKRLNLIKNPR